jgi:hypothetical protein
MKRASERRDLMKSVARGDEIGSHVVFRAWLDERGVFAVGSVFPVRQLLLSLR